MPTEDEEELVVDTETTTEPLTTGQTVLTVDTLARAVQGLRRDFGRPPLQDLIMHPQDAQEIENLMDFRRRLREHINGTIQGTTTVRAEAPMPNGDTAVTERVIAPDMVRNLAGIDWATDITRDIENQLRRHMDNQMRDQTIEAARVRMFQPMPMRPEPEPETPRELRWRIIERTGPMVFNPGAIARVNLVDPRFEPDDVPSPYKCHCGEWLVTMFKDVYLFGIYTVDVPVWCCIPCDNTRILIKKNLDFAGNDVYKEVETLRALGAKQISFKELLSVICTSKQ